MNLLPGIAHPMQIDIPRKHQMELDGISLIRDTSISHPEAKIIGNELVVSWKPYQTKKTVKIWLAETNRFNISGEADDYQLADKVDVSEKRFVFPLKKKKASFYKVVIEGKRNVVNRWLKN